MKFTQRKLYASSKFKGLEMHQKTRPHDNTHSGCTVRQTRHHDPELTNKTSAAVAQCTCSNDLTSSEVIGALISTERSTQQPPSTP